MQIVNSLFLQLQNLTSKMLITGSHAVHII